MAILEMNRSLKSGLIYLSLVLLLANQSILISAESDTKEPANEVTTYHGKVDST